MISPAQQSSDIPVPGEKFHDGYVGYHIREGEHYLSREDWNIYMQYIRNAQV